MKTNIARNLFAAVAIFLTTSLAALAQSTTGTGNTYVHNDRNDRFLHYEITTLYYYTDNGISGYQAMGYANGELVPGPSSWENTYSATLWSAFGGFLPDSIDAYYLYDLVWYYYTIAMTSPSSSNATISYGPSFTPTNTGGTGGSTRVWCVAGHTNWGTSAWTPPGPGTYTFYVGMLPRPGYTTNATDPSLGAIQVNYTAYTLTVN